MLDEFVLLTPSQAERRSDLEQSLGNHGRIFPRSLFNFFSICQDEHGSYLSTSTEHADVKSATAMRLLQL